METLIFMCAVYSVITILHWHVALEALGLDSNPTKLNFNLFFFFMLLCCPSNMPQYLKMCFWNSYLISELSHSFNLSLYFILPLLQLLDLLVLPLTSRPAHFIISDFETNREISLCGTVKRIKSNKSSCWWQMIARIVFFPLIELYPSLHLKKQNKNHRKTQSDFEIKPFWANASWIIWKDHLCLQISPFKFNLICPGTINIVNLKSYFSDMFPRSWQGLCLLLYIKFQYSV